MYQNDNLTVHASIYADDEKRPSIVVIGAGDYARYITELALEKRFPIKGAFKRAGNKVGEDLGTACGLGKKIGVVIEEIESVAANSAVADLALVAAGSSIRDNLETYRTLLAGGYNVLCMAPEANHPYFFDPDNAKEIDELAKANKVTFTGGGIWDMSRIWAGILATGPCTEIESIIHTSATDFGRQIASLEDVKRYHLAAGITVEEFWSGGYDKNPTGSYYPMMAAQVLEGIGYHAKGYTTKIEPVVTDIPMDHRLFDKPIAAGLCVGQRMVSELTTEEGVTAHSEVEIRLFKEGEEEHMTWEVKGTPHLNIKIIRDDSINVTSNSLFNRIPDVIAAPPGIVLMSQLGPLKHTALL